VSVELGSSGRTGDCVPGREATPLAQRLKTISQIKGFRDAGIKVDALTEPQPERIKSH